MRRISIFILLAVIVSRASAITYTTLDNPAGVGTFLTGISGNNIVGYYTDSSSENHGFLYNGSSFTTLDDPLAGTGQSQGTFAEGIDGNNIVGYYVDSSNVDHGFLYNGSTYTTLDDPAGSGTQAFGISGNNIVGGSNTSNAASTGGFLFDGSTYTPVNDPQTLLGGSIASGISGSTIVGLYQHGIQLLGYKYDGSTFTTISGPPSAEFAGAHGISGNDIVGGYLSGGATFGFVYDGSNYTTLADPLAVGATNALGIWGDTVVGSYMIGNMDHGFIATIPEPSSVILLGTGVVGLALYQWRSAAARAAWLYSGQTIHANEIAPATFRDVTGAFCLWRAKLARAGASLARSLDDVSCLRDFVIDHRAIRELDPK